MTVHIAPVGLSIIGNLAKIEKLKFVEEPAGPNPIEQDFPWTELIKQVQASGYLESIYPGKKPKDVMEAMFETGSAADSPERDELQEIADRINVGEWIRYRGVSAELTPYAKQPLRFLPQRRRKSSSLLEKTRYFSLPPTRIKVSQLPGGTQSHWQTATSVEFAICLISTKTPDWTRRQSDASTFFEFPDWMPSTPTRRFGNP